jgi:nucleotide-binding universal stress UspA family protein
MSTIKSNIKTIGRNSVHVPLEVAATTLEVAADATDLSMRAVKGLVPTARQLGTMVGMFTTGLFTSDMTEEAAVKLYNETSIADVMAKIEAASLKAGQDCAKLFDEDDDTVDTDTVTK